MSERGFTNNVRVVDPVGFNSNESQRINQRDNSYPASHQKCLVADVWKIMVMELGNLMITKQLDQAEVISTTHTAAL